MPYIPDEDREAAMTCPETAGDLAYHLTRDVLSWAPKSRWNFTTFALAIGVLICVTLELYRRMVAPYEDQKKAENGDVYP